MEQLRFAFVGFRHGHINALYNLARERDDIAVVAACEEDKATRDALIANDRVRITHDDYEEMLNQVVCDVIAVGDVYGKRGRLLIRALEEKKHVIAEKPICTRLSELEEIAGLATRDSLCVGCMLDLRSAGQFRKLRELTLGGHIGEVHAISFDGQHPMAFGSRPGWYFEPGAHGGTFNDIGIHAVDFIPWATGLEFIEINAARSWNAALKEVPHFMDGAQAMLTMENG